MKYERFAHGVVAQDSPSSEGEIMLNGQEHRETLLPRTARGGGDKAAMPR